MSSSNSGKVRWIALNEAEKERVLRIRNAQIARNSRQIKRIESKKGKLEEELKLNEKRIQDLQKVIHDSSSKNRKSGQRAPKSTSTNKSSAGSSRSQHTDEKRPAWFGEPF